MNISEALSKLFDFGLGVRYAKADVLGPPVGQDSASGRLEAFSADIGRSVTEAVHVVLAT